MTHIKNLVTKSANHTVGDTSNPRNEERYNDECSMVVEVKSG